MMAFVCLCICIRGSKGKGRREEEVLKGEKRSEGLQSVEKDIAYARSHRRGKERRTTHQEGGNYLRMQPDQNQVWTKAS